MDIIDERDRSVPTDFDVIADTAAHSGDWYGLAVFGAAFPNDAAGMEVDGVGRNLSSLNNRLPDGYELKARFTRVTLTAGVAVAYKG
jgi:hypothetical protein